MCAGAKGKQTRWQMLLLSSSAFSAAFDFSAWIVNFAGNTQIASLLLSNQHVRIRKMRRIDSPWTLVSVALMHQTPVRREEEETEAAYVTRRRSNLIKKARKTWRKRQVKRKSERKRETASEEECPVASDGERERGRRCTCTNISNAGEISVAWLRKKAGRTVASRRSACFTSHLTLMWGSSVRSRSISLEMSFDSQDYVRETVFSCERVLSVN